MNRADAIALDEQRKNSECKKCVGIDIKALQSKAADTDRLLSNKLPLEYQIKKGEFLSKVMIDHGGDGAIYDEAREKLLETIKQINLDVVESVCLADDGYTPMQSR
ncbi:hypothetical protein [Acinetobacter larvae]|uniref:Uncharacterized protein n=1 Tax=Acinetobacter larvae TaxID=1789224 RepID=A0A1B2LXF4_9GAMM|nr:hypothetical protein [Acinetobacter larvae]AOA57569.1 hypothetical protein BFG52_03845 [Acinetobacter larvae]